MTDNQMANNQANPGDQAKKEADQRKLLRAVIGVLKDNREALCHLPEMVEQLIEMPEAIASVEKATDTSEESG